MKSLIFVLSLILSGASYAAPLLLDVRSDKEYQQDNIKGSLHIPHTQIKQQAEGLIKNKSQVIHVYCAAGVRAQRAVDDLKALGYSNAINAGGINDVKRYK